ncbi:LamG domain-containing protein [Planctomycetota bacterium]
MRMRARWTVVAGLVVVLCAGALPSASAGLVAYWDFDDGTGSTAAEAIAGNNGTLRNMEAADWITAGLPPLLHSTSALTFDGTNEYRRRDDAVGYKGVLGNVPRAMSAWVKVPSTGAGDNAILSMGTGSPAGTKWSFRVQTANGQDGALRVEVNGGYIVGSTDIRDDQWHHVTAVLPAGVTNVQNMVLYVDGANDGYSARLSRGINTGSRDVQIGQDHSSREFKGQMDDVAIWDNELLSTQVRLLATGTPPNHPTVSIQNNLLSNWRLDQVFGTSTLDVTDDHRDGTLVGNAALATGKLDNAMDFDGADDYVDFGDVDIVDGLAAFTVAMWFNRDVNDTGGANDTNHGINNVLIAQSSNSANDNFELGTESDQVEIYLDANTPDKTVRVTIPGGISDDEWHHVVVTYDKNDGGLKLFFNNGFVTSWPEFVGNVDGSAASALTLGLARPDNQKWGDFDGLIDEVGVWSRALTADEIAYLYNGGDGRSIVVPEPATLALLGLGGLALLARRRKTR